MILRAGLSMIPVFGESAFGVTVMVLRFCGPLLESQVRSGTSMTEMFSACPRLVVVLLELEVPW